MKKRLALLLAGAMVLSAALTGCGAAKTDDTPKTEDKNPAATDTAGATPTLDAIKQKGEIVMLTNAQFPPFEYLGDDGTVKGVDPDLAQAVADKLGVKLKVVDMDFNGIVSALKSGKGDFAAAGMTITEERKKEVDFTDEYVTSSQMVVVPAGSTLTAEDAALSGKNIAVQEGTTGDWYASGDTENTGSTIKDANVLRYKSGVEAGMMLAQGKADAIIIDQKPAEAIVASQNGKLILLDKKLTDEKYAFAVQKGQDDLREFINSVLAEYKDGKVDGLITQHMGIQ
ncbi:MAG: amino acid ABC transporter substrate-binding protein [Clostridia bacterium]|nr:amino acid ABC transporter substrate-binding protein [Clostridia bacterium]